MDAHTSRVRGSSHRGGTEMCRSMAGAVSAASSVWVRSKHPDTSQTLSVRQMFAALSSSGSL